MSLDTGSNNRCPTAPNYDVGGTTEQQRTLKPANKQIKKANLKARPARMKGRLVGDTAQLIEDYWTRARRGRWAYRQPVVSVIQSLPSRLDTV
jgi:hypothetical protein